MVNGFEVLSEDIGSLRHLISGILFKVSRIFYLALEFSPRWANCGTGATCGPTNPFFLAHNRSFQSQMKRVVSLIG